MSVATQREILLNGKWKGRYTLPDALPVEFEGTVPGCAHTDLLQAGMVPDYFLDNNAEDCQWIENAYFHYSREFEFTGSTQGMELSFLGLDTFCDVFLNGKKLGYCDNMFLPHTFQVSEVLKEGKNRVDVQFYPPAKMVEGFPEYNYCFTGERVHIRRMQCTFGWDWVHRFLTMGIIDDVILRRPAATEIDCLYAAATQIDQYGAELYVQADLSAVGTDTWLELEISAPDGSSIWKQRRKAVESSFHEFVSVPHPELWYPLGYGGQPLYKLCAWVTDKAGTRIGEKEITFGIRTVRILEEADEQGSPWHEKCLEIKKAEFLQEGDRNEDFAGFILLVNGEPIFCKGANWVPCEPFPSEAGAERYRELLELAAQAHMNMLRVWGGGIVEKDAFYEICDRLGILVIQDFQMACAVYPEEREDFLDVLRLEATYAVKRLRNHPCLAWWNGDNEISAAGMLEEEGYPGRIASLMAIAPVIRAHDPYRRFMPSEPYQGKPFMSVTKGTSHATFFLSWLNSVMRKSDMSDFHQILSQFLSRFNCEMSVLGLPANSSMRRFLSGDLLYDHVSHRFHMKNHPAPEFRDFGMYDMMEKAAREFLGAFKDREDRLYKMQYIQYEWVRYTLELFRRNKWFASGLLFWMYNDCWPAIGLSMVDYYSNPKAGYYGFQYAGKPVQSSICAEENGYGVYILNDSLKPVAGDLHLFIQNMRDKKPLWECTVPFSSPANQSCRIWWGEAPLPESGAVLVGEIITAQGKERTVYFPKRIADLGLPSREDEPVRLLDRTEDTLTVQASAYVHAVGFDGDYRFEDNFFTMLPGETRTIHYAPLLRSASQDIVLRCL